MQMVKGKAGRPKEISLIVYVLCRDGDLAEVLTVCQASSHLAC